MKKGLRLLALGVVACDWVSARDKPMGEAPTFSPAEIEAALGTCRAYAREAAELRRRFPMKYGLSDAPLSEQLEACVLAVLQEDIVEPMPLS